ncbi:MAG: hypothetical protein JWO05_336 [Gemmatimonadetes bacterium]|nr:hypothetical protein [Gemmatimonadota bacterium]
MPSEIVIPRRRQGLAALLMLTLASLPAVAQLPGAPVLQNAFFNPGITIAGDFAGGGGASVFAGAASLGFGGRFGVSAGAGSSNAAGNGQQAVYGARLTGTLFQFAGGQVGLGAFLGYGGKFGSTKAGQIGLSTAPVGATVGFRHAMSMLKGISLYATPYAAITSQTQDNTATITSTTFRTGIGVDIGVTASLGLTAGVDMGAKAKAGKPGPSGTSWGVGLSWAMGRH